MKKIFTTYACLLFSIFLSAQVTGNRLWPGDINDSGLVNEVDFLYWGIAFGAEGPARPTIDGTFLGYPHPDPWSQVFPSNGLNYFYADANGDGKVDELDLVSIEESFGRRHSPATSSDDFPVNPDGIETPIIISTEVRQLSGAKEIEITIELGTEEIQVDSFYGFSFRLFYDTLFAKQGIQSMELVDNNWIEGEQGAARLFTLDKKEDGYMAVGVTRSDQNIAKGFGPVLRGIIVVEDIIFSVKPDTFDVRLDSTRLISSRMETYNTQPVAMDFLDIVTSTKRPIVNSKELKVFPNPTAGLLNIELNDLGDVLKSVKLYNFVGQSVGEVTFTGRHASHRMSVAHLSKGMYTIIAESKKGLYSQKVFIH